MAESVILIRPANFGFNSEAAKDNLFARNKPSSHDEIVKLSQNEFDQLIQVLRNNKIAVYAFQDLEPSRGPDVVFPNNWISTHANGTVIIYPMCHANRRMERRTDIVDYLSNNYNVSHVWDLTAEETNGRYLEGTGSLVFDHDTKIVYAAISQRSNKELIGKVAEQLGYVPFVFNTKNNIGSVPIYHTNVIMSIGKNYVITCLALIEDQTRVNEMIEEIRQSGKELVDITCEQVKAFCGNVIQVRNTLKELCTLMSDRAFQAFTEDQLGIIGKKSKIVHCDVQTIEHVGGGGIRCMVMENWLGRKDFICK